MADDGVRSSAAGEHKSVRGRTTEMVTDMYSRASVNVRANVSKHVQNPKVQQFGGASAMGLLLGKSVYYRFFRLAVLLAGGFAAIGLPSTEKVQTSLGKIRMTGVSEAANLDKDVIVGIGMVFGLFCSTLTMSNLFFTIMAFLSYAASGL